MRTIKYISIAIICVLVFYFISFQKNDKYITLHGQTMGTFYNIKILAPNRHIPESLPAEIEKELAKYLEVYEKQEQAKQQEKEPKADPKEEAKKPATSKAKQQTVTQPGKFVPFFQAGGTQSSGSNLLAGPQLAPRPSGYAKPRSRPGRKPGKPRGNSSFKPMNPPPHAKPVMVPGGNAGANPGSDPRLYMPPTGMKPPPPPAKRRSRPHAREGISPPNKA